MSLPALAARRSAALLLMAQQRGGGGLFTSSASSAMTTLLRRPFSSSSGGGGSVVEVADDKALAAALAACAASNSGSVVNFTAAWCGPCKAMAEPMAALAKKHPGVTFLKVDIDSPALQNSVAAAGIAAVPTYVIRKGGQVLSEIQGARLELLQKAVEQAAGK